MNTCEVTVVVKLFRRWRWPAKRFPCTEDATWISTNTCCGSSTRACAGHYHLARSNLGTINCGECGAQGIKVTWKALPHN